MFLKYSSKSYDADFVYAEKDKMLMSCLFFNETTKPRELKKKIKLIMTSYIFYLITEIKV